MKQKFIKFSCDECGTEVMGVVIPNEPVFPYEEGWVYLYDFNAQILNKSLGHISLSQMGNAISYIDRLEEKDKHFCNRSCMINYLDNLLIKEEVSHEKNRGLGKSSEKDSKRKQGKKKTKKLKS